jgi:hypothetical protein
MTQQAHYEDLPDLLDVTETARFLRISRAAAYEAIRSRLIPSLRIGRRIVVPKARLLSVIEQLTREGGDPERNR